MIDWHCHILPGLDDGASSDDEALAMARLLAAAGFTHVCCTPHRIRGMYETTSGRVCEAVARLQSDLDRAGVALALVPGMEYTLDEFFVDDFDRDPQPLGRSRRVLVETPSNADPRLLKENLFHLVRAGYQPLFAHPERHAFLAPPSRSPSMFSQVRAWVTDAGDAVDALSETLLADLQALGCRFQGNLGSVGGYYGSLVKKQEERFWRSGVYACYGSDGHSTQSLERFLGPALATVAGRGGKSCEEGFDTIAP